MTTTKAKRRNEPWQPIPTFKPAPPQPQDETPMPPVRVASVLAARLDMLLAAKEQRKHDLADAMRLVWMRHQWNTPHEHHGQYGPNGNYKVWLKNPRRHEHGFVDGIRQPKSGRVIHLHTGAGGTTIDHDRKRGPSQVATLRWDDGESPGWHNVIRAMEAAA